MSDEQDRPSSDAPDGGGEPTAAPYAPYDPVETQPAERRSTGRVAALWIGVAALLGASLFAVANLASSEGASSPEAAVEALAQAVSNEDLVGVLEALPPSERGALKDDLLGILDELERLEVLAEDFDPARISGIDLEVADLELSTKSLGDGVSRVRVSGGNTSSEVNPSQLPLGPFVTDFFDEDLPDETESESGPIEEAFDLVTIEEDGGWYVSIWYSVAEEARKNSGKPLPKFGDGLEAEGASSPEGAVEALFDAVTELDVRRILTLLPPDEARVLHDYAPLFLDDVTKGAEEALEEVEITIEKLELGTDRDGDVATVSVEDLAMNIDGPDGTVRFTFDGKCSTMSMPGEEEEKFCVDEIQEELGIPALAPLLSGGLSLPKLVTVERGGEWFLSPVRSLLGPLHDGLRGLDESDMDEVRDFIESARDGALFGNVMGMEASGSEMRLSDVAEPIGDGDGTGAECTGPFDEDGNIAGFSEEQFDALPEEEQDRVLQEAFAQSDC